MNNKPEGALVSVSPLYPPKSGRFLMVYDLDDLGVDYTAVQLYYRMAMSMMFDGAAMRNKLGGIKPWTVSSEGNVTVSPAGNYLMRLVCNVVQLMLEIKPAGGNVPYTTPVVKEILGDLQQFGDYEILVGCIADMAKSIYQLLPDHTTWVSLVTVQQHLAYVYAGQTPQEDPCLTTSR